MLSHLLGPASSSVTDQTFYDLHLENISLIYFYSSFHLFNITERQNFNTCKRLTQCLRIKKVWSVHSCIQTSWEILALMDVFCVFTLCAIILVVTLLDSFKDVRIVGKLLKCMQNIILYFLFYLYWHQINICNCDQNMITWHLHTRFNN